MKTATILVAGIMTLGLAAAANAQGLQSQGWYIGLGLAPAWFDTEYRFSDGSKISPSHDTSFNINGALGYKFDGWRFEAEPFWADTSSDTVRVVGPLAVNPLIVNPAPPASTVVHIKGDGSTGGFLFNAAYDFPIDRQFRFTAGGGIGFANVSPKLSTRNGTDIIDHSETAFAWQLIAGFVYALNPNFEFQIDYRYTGITDTGHHSNLLMVNPLSSSAPLGVSEESTNLQALMFSVRWYPEPY